MFGSQQYPEGQYEPERGAEYNWCVRCNTGALQVLQQREYVQWLADHPGKSYTLNFANGSAARISPRHPLWQILVEIAKTYSVMVFPLTWNGPYTPWTGNKDSLSAFDAISIEAKKS